MSSAENNQISSNESSEHIHEHRKTLGKILAEHRLSKGLSVADIEANTKISSVFINALEQGAFENLPGRVFGRGFIKNICSVLALDAEAILKDYDKAWAPEPPQEKQQARWQSWRIAQEPRKTFGSNRPRFGRRHLFIAFNTALVLTIVIFASRYFSHKFSPQPSPSATVEAQVQVQTPEAQPKQNPSETTHIKSETIKAETKKELVEDLTKKEEVNNTLKTSKKKPDGNSKEEENKTLDTRPTVVITVKESVVIKHRILPNDYVTTTYAPGSYRFPIDDRIDFEVSDAEAVDISFNDKNLGPLGKKGEQRKLSFFAKELQEDLANSDPDSKKL